MRDGEQPRDERPHQRRDAYDWFVLAIAFSALAATGAAAYFTWQQAAVAREQMQRALRAYVIVEPQLTAHPKTGRPLVRFATENMGQTPVYDLFFVLQAGFRQGAETLPFQFVMTLTCGNASRRQAAITGGTFSKTGSYSVDSYFSSPSRPGETVASLFAQDDRPVVYGTACYRDVFSRWHSIRICYEWEAADQYPRDCYGREDQNAEP